MINLRDMFKKADDSWEQEQKARREKYVKDTKFATDSTIVALNTLREASATAAPVPHRESGGGDGE